MHPSRSGKPGGVYPGPVGLTRFGSAPSSLLATLVDSVGAASGRGTSGGASDNEFSPAPTENMVGRYFSDDSPCLTSESSCKAGAAASPDLDPAGVYNKRKAPGLGLERSYGFSDIALGDLAMGPTPLVMIAGFSAGRGGSYSHGGADAAGGRRLKSQLSFSSRQDSFSQISELSMPDVGETNSSDEATAGTVSQSFISSGLPIGAWDESNSIVFSGKGAEESNGDIIATLGSLDSNQFGLPKGSFEMEKLFRIHQDSVTCKIRAKRGCATHPRSIAERERRTKISEKLRKLEDLVPNVDKQTNTADMLDLAVQYIKTLQGQLQKLKKEHQHCTCELKNTA
ncbi:unnamed protein product [Spirodela intermedia]|uniref:BHLH domain-containing protein n=1 Tax=Spirodela intermedia TaxID=51605 RepID=A0A7I8IT24_SPIIN|nr:unnamed protein product [Spirodela intermedia]CAA6660104.1 unnamed protein product [Spirodela intermedia]